MSPVTLFARSGLPSRGVDKGLAIAGIILVGVLVAGLLLWLAVRCYQYRMSEKRNETRGAAFLHIRGVIRAGEWTTSSIPNYPSPPTFSRRRLTPSIILPEKILTRQVPGSGSPGRAPISVPQSPASSTYPNPGSVSGSRPQPLIPLPSLHHIRDSQESTHPASTRLQPPPGLGSRPTSSASSTTCSQARPVRQLFEPVLQDELPLTRAGEYLNVLESFEDGWCLVIRDTWRSRRSSIASILGFHGRDGQNGSSATQLDIGLVPAWVFVKPTKGLTVERPMRSSSVNALQLGLSTPNSTRDVVCSWSHFA